ncbi:MULTISPECIES: hypothetical protein [unclassified Campylobacter]|uniref:hypothetical protein n=1 Tax=unclassified Campylobacter TaxID=2593542 RepID=UPI001237EE5C|nr:MULTISPECIES: hypothetical protein [unclassified Campylobacter]KAA6227649.1 hypothetical protein FMM54_02380 [Campylobacter sp. LR185c]KAA6228855.1 hypothetical protein FMM57_02190 [Campylobacter sp. LR286c]KAA6229036.1 hypothetical protein FMM55_00075 [Campylobacter sp. LR196d]KAA6233899.1 hypothetical protein FMM58_01470 [Campylobacter sp. LR291e]KAA6234004.1 hypothetical protein FMM56_01635 [Campylobacter sp. LR264d]
MFFGFDKKDEFIPEIYANYNRTKINEIFLYQYNANVDDDLKIPLSYAKKARNLKEIFKLFLYDLSNVNFAKIDKICLQASLFVKNFKTKKPYFFNATKSNESSLKKLFKLYFYGACFKNSELFTHYVYDKISRQNPNLNFILKDNLLIINKEFALLIFDKKIDTNKLDIDNEIQKALSLITKNSFCKLYIVCPRSENFTHFIQIKHDLCDLNKIMLKLVPYSISNKLIRRL